MSLRFSQTLQAELMYVAVPLRINGELLGIVRTAQTTSAISHIIGEIQGQIIIAGIIVALLAAVISLWMSRRITRPLTDLREGAEHFAQGDFSHRLPTSQSEEIAALSESMNFMAAQLDDRIRTIIRQRNEIEAILVSMVEGVIAVDTDERLISLNRAAAELLDLDKEEAIGQSIQEAVRNIHLQDLVHDILEQQETLETEIILGPNLDERYIHANGTLLRDARGNLIGVLIVLNDVTRLRRLEKVRQEFVANVSHELKTPVTSIKGFVETLLDSAGDEGERQRFLKIIARQADRLNAIIDDLLILSRIEQMVDARHVSLSEHRLLEIIADAVEACEVRATRKSITVNVDCPENLAAPVNAALLEQALINLVDNALKYSDSAADVKIVARQESGDAVISVIDTGRGIESEHLPRLFERFYRVEKARSREMGGTGLGLAIVKHIMRAHRGNVTVESTLGSGSTFNLHIPLEASQAAPV
jgi:two-component system phosphate regulon sensor histidine kinase PhoR